MQPKIPFLIETIEMDKRSNPVYSSWDSSWLSMAFRLGGAVGSTIEDELLELMARIDWLYMVAIA